jgi:hypothetical protein
MVRVMLADPWKPWPKRSPELLAHYVNQEAARKAMPSDFFVLKKEDQPFQSFHDLRAAGQLDKMACAIYDKLCELDIEYDDDPVFMDDPSGQLQVIRPPAEVIERKKGTCIDLALLFAGLCIEVSLLPLVIILGSNLTSFHALVVIDGKYTYDGWKMPRGWGEEHQNNGWLNAESGKDLWKKGSGELWKRIEDGLYIPLECTGFAHTFSDARRQPTLSFDEARQKGEENLFSMIHVFTLDIVRMQEGKGYKPYDPIDLNNYDHNTFDKKLATIVQEGVNRLDQKLDSLKEISSSIPTSMDNYQKKIPINMIRSTISKRDIPSIKELVNIYSNDLTNEVKAEIYILIGDENNFDNLMKSDNLNDKLLYWKSRGDFLRGRYYLSLMTFMELLINNQLENYFKINCIRNIANILTDIEIFNYAEKILNMSLSILNLDNKNDSYFKAKIYTDFTRWACRSHNLGKVEYYGKQALSYSRNENFPWVEQIVVIEILKYYEKLRLEGYTGEDILIDNESETRIENINKQLENYIGIMSWNLVKALRLINNKKKEEANNLLNTIIFSSSKNPFNFYGTYEAFYYLNKYYEFNTEGKGKSYLNNFQNEKVLVTDNLLDKISLCFPNI